MHAHLQHVINERVNSNNFDATKQKTFEIKFANQTAVEMRLGSS